MMVVADKTCWENFLDQTDGLGRVWCGVLLVGVPSKHTGLADMQCVSGDCMKLDCKYGTAPQNQ